MLETLFKLILGETKEQDSNLIFQGLNPDMMVECLQYLDLHSLLQMRLVNSNWKIYAERAFKIKYKFSIEEYYTQGLVGRIVYKNLENLTKQNETSPDNATRDFIIFLGDHIKALDSDKEKINFSRSFLEKMKFLKMLDESKKIEKEVKNFSDSLMNDCGIQGHKAEVFLKTYKEMLDEYEYKRLYMVRYIEDFLRTTISTFSDKALTLKTKKIPLYSIKNAFNTSINVEKKYIKMGLPIGILFLITGCIFLGFTIDSLLKSDRADHAENQLYFLGSMTTISFLLSIAALSYVAVNHLNYRNAYQWVYGSPSEKPLKMSTKIKFFSLSGDKEKSQIKEENHIYRNDSILKMEV